MKQTTLYIGSNNETKLLEIEKIESILVQWLSDFTITLATGYYKGGKENTAVVTIIGEYNLGIIPMLKTELKQECILVVEQIVSSKLQ